jgi:hypothetical protein
MVPPKQISAQNGEMNVLFNKYHRRINMMALFFSNFVFQKEVLTIGVSQMFRTIEMPKPTSLLVFVVFCAKKVKWRKSVP